MAAHAIDQAANWSVSTKRQKHAHTGANQRSFVIDPFSRSLPKSFLASVLPRQPLTKFPSASGRTSVQYFLKRTSRATRAALPTCEPSPHLSLVCHLLPYQNLLSHHARNFTATAGVVRDKPYGFSDLRAAFELSSDRLRVCASRLSGMVNRLCGLAAQDYKSNVIALRRAIFLWIHYDLRTSFT